MTALLPSLDVRRHGSRLRIHWLLYAALLSWGLWANIQIIGGGVPYSEQLDEATLSKAAAGIFVQGDPNPHFFRYPSFPIYLCAAAYAVGYAEARWFGEIGSRSELWSPASFRADRRLARWARLVFAAFGLITLGATGLLARVLSGRPHALYLAPLILFGSGLYQFQARRYLNVDVVGAALCMLCLLFLVWRTARGRLAGSAPIAGMLIGLAAASKYTLAVVAAPWLLAYLMDEPRRSARRIVALLAVSALTFVLAVPYSVLDSASFLADIRAEAIHYRVGHAGLGEFTSAPGFDHARWMLNDVVADYGGALAGLALVGVVTSMRKNWRLTAQVLSFPLLLASALAIHRTHFARNALTIHALAALYAGIGILASMRGLRVAAAAHGLFRGGVWPRRALSGLVLAAAAVTFPWDRMPATHRLSPDSRISATEWLLEHARPGAHVYVPDVLGFDARPFEGRFHVQVLSLEAVQESSALPVKSGDYVLLPRVADHPGRSWERRAEQIERAFQSVEPLVSFGFMPIVLGTKFWHTQGWTALSVGVVP